MALTTITNALRRRKMTVLELIDELLKSGDGYRTVRCEMDCGSVYAESTSITVETPDDCSVLLKCKGKEI